MRMNMMFQKPGTLTLTVVMLLGVCPTLLAQTPKANLNGNHSRREAPPEDVYFNADGTTGFFDDQPVS